MDSEVSQRIFPPSPAPGTTKHFLGLGSHIGDTAGDKEGTKQGGFMKREDPTNISCAVHSSASGWSPAATPRATQAALQ